MILQRDRGFIPDCSMPANFVVVLTPIFQLFSSVFKAQETLGIQTLRSEAATRQENLLDSVFEIGLSSPTRLVVVGGCVDDQHSAGSTYRHPPRATHLVDKLASRWSRVSI